MERDCRDSYDLRLHNNNDKVRRSSVARAMIHGVADFVTRCYFRPSLNISRPRETRNRRRTPKKCRRDISKGWHELISWAGPNQLLPDSFLRRCCVRCLAHLLFPPSPSFLRGGGAKEEQHQQHTVEISSIFLSCYFLLIFLIFSHLQPFHLCHLLPRLYLFGAVGRVLGTMGNGRRRRGMARNNNTTHVIFHP